MMLVSISYALSLVPAPSGGSRNCALDVEVALRLACFPSEEISAATAPGRLGPSAMAEGVGLPRA